MGRNGNTPIYNEKNDVVEYWRKKEIKKVIWRNNRKKQRDEGKNNFNNNIYLLQLGCHPVAVVILHVNKTRNWLLINLSREGYMRSM